MIMDPTPSEIVKAHQYLYYVALKPVWSDYQYDMYCDDHGIEGIGGSDRAEDYTDRIKELAEQIFEEYS